ncbi:MAG TPA: 7-cyano-7-deazaguanine synthase QueC, partial [Acidiferrobacteraceae bacterium]|nr:7-cyano-7-deazaguanine synthase QueC [Acidiferrobacteraceae bacterium]HEX20157.1 7-cyano-7-deazaguanine synthase QueC [Acidiferrobacteraceae bacterium]
MAQKKSRPAVVLLSGGLDSATALALAKSQGYLLYALTFDYGQRHRAELEAAGKIADTVGVVEHRVVTLDVGWMGGSALTDNEIAVPQQPGEGIPVTYVPARNTIFLAVALAWAETLAARDIIIGINAVDYSGYPDCRPEFLEAFNALAALATRAGVDGRTIRVLAPLMDMDKAGIIRTGDRLGVDYALTLSCYNPDNA